MSCTRRLPRAMAASALLLACLGATTAHAAEWVFVGYRLLENGHPCINDPYTKAGYVWIRKDENTKSHQEQLKATVKAENAKADIEYPRAVRPGQSIFLVAKSVKCRDWNSKTHLVTSYMFVAAADEAGLRSHMVSEMKLYPDITDYTFEDITRSPAKLDEAGTATVIGRSQ